MQLQIVNYKTAALAKKKGFKLNNLSYDGETGFYYEAGNKNLKEDEINYSHPNIISAPTQALLQKWLREKYDIHFEIKPIFNTKNIRPYVIHIIKNPSGEGFKYKLLTPQDNYEKALEIALQEGLKII